MIVAVGIAVRWSGEEQTHELAVAPVKHGRTGSTTSTHSERPRASAGSISTVAGALSAIGRWSGAGPTTPPPRMDKQKRECEWTEYGGEVGRTTASAASANRSHDVHVRLGGRLLLLLLLLLLLTLLEQGVGLKLLVLQLLVLWLLLLVLGDRGFADDFDRNLLLTLHRKHLLCAC
uniref:Uncharacterized protein n=1 Tax=Anopheles farauti TaxID=69004 RepID=A0A182QWX1_9DIPT